jgi:MFS family permease
MAATEVEVEPSAFGAPFWFTYASSTSMMIAVSLLFRYADFVKLLDGSELHLGLIVGVGMVGSLLMRIGQGVGIDRYGPRVIWLLSAALFGVSCLAHLLVTEIDGPFIFLVRILFQTSVAGFFGASITYISGRAPIVRMAEIIGNLGTSGFVGMVLGTFLSDQLLGASTVGGLQLQRFHVDRLFIAAAMLGSAALVLGWFATGGHQMRRSKRQAPPLLWVVRRYNPGSILLVGVAMGFGLGLPPIFLRPFLAQLNIAGIFFFFFFYPLTAFATRLAIRRLPEILGIRPMILMGLASLAGSMLLFLVVSETWHLTFPAILLGIAHASLFPSVVAGGSGVFPVRYRGLGTTLVLAMFDLGSLIGSPTIGTILHVAGRYGWPRYATMFVTVSALLTLVGAIYAVTSRSVRLGQSPRRVKRKLVVRPLAVEARSAASSAR